MPTHYYIIETRIGRDWRPAWGFDAHETEVEAIASIERKTRFNRNGNNRLRVVCARRIEKR